MNSRITGLLIIVIHLLAAASALAGGPTDPALVPAPVLVESAAGSFSVNVGTTILVEPGHREVRVAGAYLADRLEEHGLPRPFILEARGPDAPHGAILLTTVGADATLGQEGYELEITPGGVCLRAPTAGGLFHGVQTIRQLLPVESDLEAEASPAGDSLVVRMDKSLPCLRIVDQPRYRWRGMLLDCCRHFMEPEFVKRCIDLLAYHKMNVLHWHLTEDQGWRIEIKKYPRLTEVGAWRGEGEERYGGFYTQEQIQDIVEYARSRHVTVVPEIEMPGHAQAALASYPELSCTGGPFDVSARWGVHKDVYCAGNDQVFSFLQDVLDECLELFPSEYIHIGGDECPKDRWRECPKCQARMKAEGLADEDELQSWFIRRIEAYLNSKGRRLIGWDEILEGGLAPNATVQSWRGMEGAVAAARAGHDVISSPITHCYLDYPQVADPGKPAWMGVIDWKRTYGFEPTPPELTAEQARHVLGAEGNVWTERIPQERVELMLFPRLAALAEVTWSPPHRRNWDDFWGRMKTHFTRLDALGVDYFIPPPRSLTPVTVFTDTLEVRLDSPLEEGVVRYTLDGSDPGPHSPAHTSPLKLTSTTLVNARTFTRDGTAGAATQFRFTRQQPLAPVRPEDAVQGLDYHAYLGKLENLDGLAEAEPLPLGATATLDLGLIRPRDQHYAIIFSGYLSVPEDGIYTFHLTSDDGSRLFIGDVEVVDNDGRHGTTEMPGQIILKAGRHPLRVEYFQGWGFQDLRLDYEGPGIPRQPVPASAFSH
jgi:hexosaminidase